LVISGFALFASFVSGIPVFVITYYTFIAKPLFILEIISGTFTAIFSSIDFYVRKG
jgi:hypothetical protein